MTSTTFSTSSDYRMDPHAQKEIRLYAETMFAITKKVAPLACESFENHLLGGVRFSKQN
jgi:thymidylate synthase (FAD)